MSDNDNSAFSGFGKFVPGFDFYKTWQRRLQAAQLKKFRSCPIWATGSRPR